MTDPIITIIVPVYNDHEGIQTTLDTLLTQSGDDYRIIVVDNNSTDCTPEVVRSYADDRISLLYETEIQSSYAARNTGIRNTESEIIGFVDADMVVPDDWLDSVREVMRTTNVDYMGCNVELTLPDNPSLSARYDYHTGFPINDYLEHQKFVPTCCLFVRREVFTDVGLFDPRVESGGDKEFGDRVHRAGYNQHFADNITVYHPTRNSIGELVSKDRRVGRGLCQLQRHHPDRYGTQGIPPRPSGIKQPDPDLSVLNRIIFTVLSNMLTGARGFGYYREYIYNRKQKSSITYPN